MRCDRRGLHAADASGVRFRVVSVLIFLCLRKHPVHFLDQFIRGSAIRYRAAVQERILNPGQFATGILQEFEAGQKLETILFTGWN